MISWRWEWIDRERERGSEENQRGLTTRTSKGSSLPVFAVVTIGFDKSWAGIQQVDIPAYIGVICGHCK